jgi:hypothetical protein
VRRVWRCEAGSWHTRPHLKKGRMAEKETARGWAGRVLLVGFLVAYFAALTVGSQVSSRIDFWRRLGVPAVSPIFSDAHILTTALDAHRHGVDPLGTTINGQKFLNPRIWLELARLGLDARQRIPIAVLSAGVGILCAFLFLGRIGGGGAAAAAAFLCSPSVMTAVERGNPDLLIFALVALAILLPGPGRSLLLFLASVFRLYPVFGFAREKTLLARLAFGAFLVYVALSWHDLALIDHIYPYGATFSYGRRVLFDGVAGFLHRDLHGGILSTAAAAAVLCAARLAARRFRPLATSDGFHIGAAIYLGTFLLGSSWDYRLIFLLFTLPQLLAWRGNSRLRRFSIAVLAATFAAVWLPGFPVMLPGVGKVTWPLENLADWFLFFGLASLCFASDAPAALLWTRPSVRPTSSP